MVRRAALTRFQQRQHDQKNKKEKRICKWTQRLNESARNMSFVCAYTCELNELVWAAATARREGQWQGQEQAQRRAIVLAISFCCCSSRGARDNCVFACACAGAAAGASACAYVSHNGATDCQLFVPCGRTLKM